MGYWSALSILPSEFSLRRICVHKYWGTRENIAYTDRILLTRTRQYIELVKGTKMHYAGNRTPAIHSVVCITETPSSIGLKRPINEHQATGCTQAWKETRAPPANKEEHENKNT